jgi:hypothetical protein
VRHLKEITLFVEGKFDRIDENAVAAHLRECDHCRQDYKTAVLFNWFWRGDRKPVTPLPTPQKNSTPSAATSRDPVSVFARVTRRLESVGKRVALAPPGLAVLVGAVALWLYVGTGGNEPVPDPVVQSIRTGATAVSSGTDFVLPGTEADFRPGTPVYRSSFRGDDDALTNALISLTDKKHSGKASSGDLYWLTAGFVASGQLDEAAISAADALYRYPRDGELLTLAAVIECMSGDSARSERLLRDAVRVDPDDLVIRLNLAVVLLKTGKLDEAESLLDGVVRANPDSRLAQRAIQLLP